MCFMQQTVKTLIYSTLIENLKNIYDEHEDEEKILQLLNIIVPYKYRTAILKGKITNK